MTVREVSRLARVSVRTLQYYDRIGLLHPSGRTEAGYRLYAKEDLARLQRILIYRSLDFPLKDIRRIVESADYDRDKALEQQIELLKLKKEHLEKLIALASEMLENGEDREVNEMSFEAFDTSRLEEYAAQAKASWGKTEAWQEYEKKSAGRTMGDEKAIAEGMMTFFDKAADLLKAGADPASEESQEAARGLQAFITKNWYTCTMEIFAGLGRAYGSGGEFTKNIDSRCGAGTGAFMAKAVDIYCAGRTGHNG